MIRYIKEMGFQRKQIINALESERRNKIYEHFIYLYFFPNYESANVWKESIAKQILDIDGIKLSNSAKLKYKDYYKRLYEDYFENTDSLSAMVKNYLWLKRDIYSEKRNNINDELLGDLKSKLKYFLQKVSKRMSENEDLLFEEIYNLLDESLEM